MSDRLSPEQIQSSINYKKGDNGLQRVVETINYYKQVGAEKPLDWYEEQKDLYQQEIDSLEVLLSKGAEEIDTPKVRITEYKGNVVIETIDPGQFDQDFSRPILGHIGCSLFNTERLEMSQEAIDAISRMSSTGYGMGDFMASEDHFTWVGPEFCIKTPDCVRASDHRTPKVFKLIENTVSDKAKEFIDSGSHISKPRPKKEIKHNLWIELLQHSNWEPKEDEPNVNHYVHSDFHILDIRIHNHNEGEELSQEDGEEIKSLVKGLFEGFEGSYKGNYNWEETGIKIPKEDLMSFVNGLFKAGFDNNIMNPRMDYWRMSMEATVEELKKALKSFKRA